MRYIENDIKNADMITSVSSIYWDNFGVLTHLSGSFMALNYCPLAAVGELPHREVTVRIYSPTWLHRSAQGQDGVNPWDWVQLFWEWDAGTVVDGSKCLLNSNSAGIGPESCPNAAVDY